MSKSFGKLKGYKIPESEVRPLSNKFIEVIAAGMASAGPPLGPLLGKYGINIANFCKEFNKKSSEYIPGIPLPCVVTVNPDRSFKLAFRKPDFGYYLLAAAGITSFQKYKGICGRVTIKHIYEISKIRHEDPHNYLQVNELKDIVKRCLRFAHENGIEVVRELDIVEYEQYLKERQEYLAVMERDLEKAKETKLLRA